MHRDTLQHPKLLLLARRLDIPRPYAAGLLESIWHFTAQYTPDGRLGKYTPAMVAEFIDYPGDPGDLFEALTETGWLDAHPGGCRVHDWYDHCDDAVHMRMARAGQRFADGRAPKLTRLSKKERIQAEALLQANDARRAHKQRTTGAPAETASGKAPRPGDPLSVPRPNHPDPVPEDPASMPWPVPTDPTPTDPLSDAPVPTAPAPTDPVSVHRRVPTDPTPTPRPMQHPPTPIPMPPMPPISPIPPISPGHALPINKPPQRPPFPMVLTF